VNALHGALISDVAVFFRFVVGRMDIDKFDFVVDIPSHQKVDLLHAERACAIIQQLDIPFITRRLGLLLDDGRCP